ncbi:cytochrome b561 and DOMON domain-containing protein At5g47530 [Ricinus communis]|uniref:cytochrome b561 and DOMON domain-containing protein At5g47530 n=1 Tax=Ricinus communis TaxID=3988 RepID=UPI00201A3650|nr:cytochrome b561 and DOMON domain-containing protein At5g47530 [Ricinus communis]
MDIPSGLRLLIGILISLVLVTSAQSSCSNYIFPNNEVFISCTDLPALQAQLHWNYIASSRIVHIAYKASQTSRGWIAWAINPTGIGMVGSQALVAFQNSNGSMIAYTTPITSSSPSMQPGVLSFKVSNISATYANNEMTIFAMVGPLENGTTVNHVWQAGDSVMNGIPQAHALSGPNIKSMGSINFFS